MNEEQERRILIHPKRGKKEQAIGARGLLLVNPSEAIAMHDEYAGKGACEQYLFNSRLTVGAGANGFIAGPAIGAPMAALTMEKLIALGAGELILFGWCGAVAEELRIGDILVPTGAESGEGTSRYYTGLQQPGPDKDLSNTLSQKLQKQGVEVAGGCVWSTDAVFREDQHQLFRLHTEKGVVAVDMEFSALCAVASFRGISFAAVLVVSDELYHDRWRPGFKDHRFRNNKTKALAVVSAHINVLQG